MKIQYAVNKGCFLVKAYILPNQCIKQGYAEDVNIKKSPYNVVIFTLEVNGKLT